MASINNASTMKATTATIAVSQSNRDHLFRTFLDGITEEVRRKLITVSLKSIPKKVAFIDGMIVIYILVKIGMVDLDNVFDDCIDNLFLHTAGPERWSCGVDDNGRIDRLRIGESFLGNDITYHITYVFNLPVSVQYLERLTHLTVINCQIHRSLHG